ncbi:ATP-binding protein [Streptomyces hydrogenans]|uniref:ATP-binding protein n=1 Tax=Streptomyces hydrogenans TaxID=1873719 RepID=UPI0033AF6FC5
MTERAGHAGYFCVSGRPVYGGSFANLDRVPDELRTVREGLRALGLTDLFPGAEGDGDALSHHELKKALVEWSKLAATHSGPRTATLVVYVTGHGFDLEGKWVLAPTEYDAPADQQTIPSWDTTQPAQLIEALGQRGDLAQVLLILDACGAGPGGEQALLDSIARAPFRDIDDRLDLWVVAAARQAEKALETVFSEAFATALREATVPSTERAHLDLAEVMDSVQTALRPTRQSARTVAGYGDPHCRALPNPLHMPSEPPTWLPPGWDAVSRGVVNDAASGWYFTGRDAALRTVLDHLTGAGTAPPLWLTGAHGSGKTAVLGRVVTTATAALRAELPTVARHGVLPAGDLAPAAVDARGRTTDRIAADIARALGLDAGTATGLTAELRRLGAASNRCVVVDHLDEAEDPEAVRALVEDLAAAPAVRVVIGAARPLPGRPAHPLLDLDDPAHQGAASVSGYLRTRLAYGGKVSDGDVAELERLCGGSFAAAVAAADAFFRDGVGSVDRARQAAAARLDALLRRTLRELLPEKSAAAVADTLTVLCSFGEDVFLDAGTWAAVAARLAGSSAPPLPAPELAAVLPACAPLVVRRDDSGTRPGRRDGGDPHGAWRPRHPRPADDQAPRRTVLRHLLDELRAAGRGWEAVGPHLLAVLAAAAADPTTGMRDLLDDPDFLLALPRTTMTRTVRALRGPDQAARTAVWNAQPRRGTPQQRRFALTLTAVRRGLTTLAGAAGPVTVPYGSVEVLWANPAVRARHTTTRVAAAGAPGAGSLITAHDDGTLVWWNGADGTETATRPGLGPLRDLHALPYTGDPGTPPDGAGASALVVLADGAVLRCAHDAADPGTVLRQATGELPGPSAAHPAGLLAVATGPSVEVLSASGTAEVRTAEFRESVVALALAGGSEDPVVWAATLDGVVHRWALDGPGAPRRVALCPHPVRLAASAEGDTAVIVDAAGACTFVGGAASLAGSLPRLGTALRAVHLTDGWFAVAGGDRDGGWLDTHSVVDGPGSRWPLDGLPVGVRSHGPDGLIVATSGTLALLRARTRPRPVPDAAR